MQLIRSGPRAGMLEVGSWRRNLLRPSTLARLRALFAQHRPADLDAAHRLAEEHGPSVDAGREEPLQEALWTAYNLPLPAPNGPRCVARRAGALAWVLDPGDGRFAVVFPGPAARRARFIGEWEAVLREYCDYPADADAADSAAAAAAAQHDPAIFDGWAADGAEGGMVSGLAPPAVVRRGIAGRYAETIVPEVTGPLVRDPDGSSRYGKKIRAGGHELADGVRAGSAWLAHGLVAGTSRFSQWLGPSPNHPEAEVWLPVDYGTMVRCFGHL